MHGELEWKDGVKQENEPIIWPDMVQKTIPRVILDVLMVSVVHAATLTDVCQK
jgi:hypothetical protein